MPRFQSRLFNWIDQSLPVSLGRKARRALSDVTSGHLWRHLSWADWQAWWQKIWSTPELPRLAGYQVVRALLMPARIVTAPLRRKYLGLIQGKQTLDPALPGSEQSFLPAGLPGSIALNSDADLTADLINSTPQTVATPLLEAQFYELWWTKPKYQQDHGNNFTAINQNDSVNYDSLATELDLNLDSLNNYPEQLPEPKTPLPPLWLRPLVRFTAWLENQNIKVETQITALTIIVNTSLATISTRVEPTPEAERLAANRAFAAAFAESLKHSGNTSTSSSSNIASHIASQNTNPADTNLANTNSQNNNLKYNQSSQLSRNPLHNLSYNPDGALKNYDSDNSVIDHNQPNGIDANSATANQWQKIQGLLAAALDYFTGRSARQLQGENENKDAVLNDDNLEQQNNLSASDNSASPALSGKDALIQKNLGAKKSAKNLKAKPPAPELTGLNAPALNSTGDLVPDFAQVPIVADQQFPNSTLNLPDDSANSLANHSDNTSLDTPPQPLANQDPLARLSELLDAAADYFFGKKTHATAPHLDDHAPNDTQLAGNNDAPILEAAAREAPWLSLEDVFGGDDGPWPLPSEHDSLNLHEMNNLPLPQLANRLAISETTTTQITADRLTANLAFDENESWLDISNQPQDSLQVKRYRQLSLDAERPLRAWIETQAQSLGYVYGPVLSVVHWLDSLIVKIENFFVICGRKIKQIIRWLFRRSV